MKKLENFFYEIRPYFFITMACLTLAKSNGSELRFVSGILLLLTACFVVQARMQYRHRGH